MVEIFQNGLKPEKLSTFIGVTVYTPREDILSTRQSISMDKVFAGMFSPIANFTNIFRATFPQISFNVSI
jgi:hypothetical protein